MISTSINGYRRYRVIIIVFCRAHQNINSDMDHGCFCLQRARNTTGQLYKLSSSCCSNNAEASSRDTRISIVIPTARRDGKRSFSNRLMVSDKAITIWRHTHWQRRKNVYIYHYSCAIFISLHLYTHFTELTESVDTRLQPVIFILLFLLSLFLLLLGDVNAVKTHKSSNYVICHPR